VTRKSLPLIEAGEAAPGAPERPLDPARRAFLRTAAAGSAVAALSSCGLDMEDFLRKHFKELSPAELGRVLAKVEQRNQARFGRKTTVRADGPRPGVEFGYGLDLSRCVGCRRCVYACVRENNQSREHPQIHWIRVLEMEKEHGVDLAHSEIYYEAEGVPRPGKFYFPVQCQQCRNPPAAELNPDQHYLGNRPRPKGVVEKCTFCIQRTRQGRYPACVEVCPVGARKFGNLLDPESEIRKVMETKRVFVFKEELATHPQFYYFYAT